MKTIKLLSSFFFLSLGSFLFGQELDWLKKSTSNDVFSNHSFYCSTQNNNDFYFAGDFWKDLTIDGVNIEIGGDTGNGFILRMDEKGNANALWHLKSNNYVRINDIAVNPTSGSLIATGNFTENLVFDGQQWNADFYSQGFVMSIYPDGSLDWINIIDDQTELSFAIGQAIVIDGYGNVIVGIEAGGELKINNQSFVFEEETQGILIAKFDLDGGVINIDQWDSKIFEGGIDIIDMSVDMNNNLYIGGCVFGSIEIADSIHVFSPFTNSNFLIKQNNDLNLQWLKTYESTRSHVLDILVNGDDLLLSIQYNSSINIDGKILLGTGSWGETAIVSLDENAEVNWVENFTLTENGGNSGVYGNSITAWNDEYYIAGMYQGDVIHNGEVILDNSQSGASYQYPFIFSLDKEGEFTSVFDFVGSNEPGRISSISANESHLLFGGDFSGEIEIGDTSVSTVNSALFYGALSNTITGIEEITDKNELLEIYPSISSDYIYLKTALKVENISLISSNGMLLKEFLGDTKVIDITELTAGIYFLSAEIAGEKTTVKFIKQ